MDLDNKKDQESRKSLNQEIKEGSLRKKTKNRLIFNNKQKIYLGLIFTHVLEHVVQIIQLYGFHMSRSNSLGLLGLKFPILVHNETLHFSFAIFTLLGLYLFKPNNPKAFQWWTTSLYLSIYHLIEHSLLMYQYLTKSYFFGREVPTAIGQLWFPRLELHFFYNMTITISTCIFLYYQNREIKINK